MWNNVQSGNSKRIRSEPILNCPCNKKNHKYDSSKKLKLNILMKKY